VSSLMAHRGADVWFVDVGQGHATVAVCHGRAMVIDCPARGADAVVALLDEHGDNTDAILVTHRDLDHCGGIRRVVDRHPPAVLYMNPSYALPPSGTEKMKVRTVLRGIFSAADVHGVSVLPIHRGDSGTLADMGWDALAPTYRTVLDSSLTDATNRSSVVLRMSFDKRRVLITGDIDAAAIDALLKTGDDISAYVLLVPHHGAVIRGLDRLVDAVDPRIAVISAGRSAGTHPALPTLEGLAARASCRIMCTQVNRFCHAAAIGSPTCAGTIRVRLDTDEVTVEPSVAEHDQRIDSFASPVCRQQN
jgi:competence protein ComEC